jgi:hypothetical protein
MPKECGAETMALISLNWKRRKYSYSTLKNSNLNKKEKSLMQKLMSGEKSSKNTRTRSIMSKESKEKTLLKRDVMPNIGNKCNSRRFVNSVTKVQIKKWTLMSN